MTTKDTLREQLKMCDECDLSFEVCKLCIYHAVDEGKRLGYTDKQVDKLAESYRQNVRELVQQQRTAAVEEYRDSNIDKIVYLAEEKGYHRGWDDAMVDNHRKMLANREEQNNG
jgi:hypothetical protein